MVNDGRQYLLGNPVLSFPPCLAIMLVVFAFNMVGDGLRAENRREMLEHALFREEEPFILKPRDPKFCIDEQYILYAVGLLSQVEPEKVLNLARKYLKQI